MTTRIVIGAIGALFGLVVLAFLLLGLYMWWTLEPKGFSEE